MAADRGDLVQLDALTKALDCFAARFRDAYGAEPTPDARATKQLAEIVTRHGAAEVQRRIGLLFERPPSWLQPPFALATLVRCFDNLVTASRKSARRGNGLTPTEILQRANQMAAASAEAATDLPHPAALSTKGN